MKDNDATIPIIILLLLALYLRKKATSYTTVTWWNSDTNTWEIVEEAQ